MTFKVIDKTTGAAPDLQKIALEEAWAKGLIWCDMEGFAVEEDGTLLLLDECGSMAYCPEGRFEVIWNDKDPEPVVREPIERTPDRIAELLLKRWGKK